MKIHILTNALAYADAVSSHCILLKKRAEELGLEAVLYSEFWNDRVREHVTPVARLTSSASREDVLLHQFFNATNLMNYVEDFPGARILMYHNITPPEYFPEGSAVYESCAGGLRLLRSLNGLYDQALGMSEFSRKDLEKMGFARTGTFPLFVDFEYLRSLMPKTTSGSRPWPPGSTFLFVGRVAPNKCVADLLRFLAAYRRSGADARLIIVGDDKQHPSYTAELHELAQRLGLSRGENLVFTGKIPDNQLARWYRTADAFITLSEHEGFCAPLLEAMALGLPVFAYRAGAVEETLGGTGVLLANKDFDVVARTVREIVSDEERRKSLVEAQIKRAEMFSPDAQRAALQKILDDADRSFRVAAPANPRVSVIINTYNRASQLERCLATLQQQTYRNFEVVVVNGPSTDATPAVLRRFEGKIRTANTTSRVLSVSRNIGLKASRGELVAFIDDDAVAEPHWLEELIKPFQDQTVGGAGGLVYRMNGRDVEFCNGIIDTEGFVRWNEPLPGAHWGWHSGYLNTVSGNNCMFRRSALEKIRGFDERIEYYHDEADVVMRLDGCGFRTVHRPRAIVYHEGARSENRRGKYKLNWRVICKNTIYCALKNYTGPVPHRRLARRIASRVARVRMGDILRWWLARQIYTFDFIRMEYACLRGIARGIRQGLAPLPLYAELSPVSGEDDLLPYPHGKERQLSVCLLTQDLPQDHPGGIANYTINLCRGLREQGCAVHVISRGAGWSSRLEDGIWFHTAQSVPLDPNLFDAKEYPSAAKNLSYSYGVRNKLLDVESRWGLDVIESPNWDAEGLFTAMERRIPMVVRAHSPMTKVAENQQWDVTEDIQLCSSLERALMRHADAVSGSTRAVLSLLDDQPDCAEKTALVPLGIEFGNSSGSLPAAKGRKRILFVGRLEHRKGIHVLLEAIPRVLLASDAVDFDIVGRDGGNDWMHFWRTRGGPWRDRVNFRGEVTEAELHRFYADCDIFVAPSLYESFGLIYLEAMSYGKPVVACHAGGVPEVVLNGQTGILVPPDDPVALADALLQLANDDARARELGEAGRQRFKECFTIEVMASRTLELYRKVAKSWRDAADIVWCGSVLDLHREAGSSVIWHPETGQVCAVVEKGNSRTAVYGPYIKLEIGSYRAEFRIFIDASDSVNGCFGSIDVFSVTGGLLAERAFGAADFTAGPGSTLDMYFSVDRSFADYEFRLHTAGIASLYLRQVLVRNWPTHGSLGSNPDDETAAINAQAAGLG